MCCTSDDSSVVGQPIPTGDTPIHGQDRDTCVSSSDADFDNGKPRDQLPKVIAQSEMEDKVCGKEDPVCLDTCCLAEVHSVKSRSLTSNDDIDDGCCASRTESPGSACQSHLDAAYKKYRSYIQMGRCICRSVLGPLEICCSKERRETAVRAKTASEFLAESRVRHSMVQDKKKSGSTTGASSTGQSHDDAVRRGEPKVHALRNISDDIEKGHSGDVLHVEISISGMTCTSCSKKGMKVLDKIEGVTSPSINFVAGKGEFDLDSRLNPTKVISQFERETGFKSVRIEKQLQRLDVLMSKLEAEHLEDKSIAGIDSVLKVDKRTYSIIFDPITVGARSVLSHIPSGSLAAPRNEGTLIDGKKRLTQTAWSTAFAATLTVPVVVLVSKLRSIFFPLQNPQNP